VVPFAAGGEADVLGRIVGKAVSDGLGKPVVVENVSGGGGTTGAARVAKAPPDGYTFMYAGRGQFVLQTLSKAPLYSLGDFAPVALIAETPIMLIARNDLPANNVPEFIAYTKANQAKMQYGSPGAGSTPHLSCVLFNNAIGVSVTHVPYRSGGAAMQDLLAGRLDYQCTGVSTAMAQIEAGKIKALAMLTRDRSPIVPTLASAHEQGVTDFDASVWYSLFLPKGTPAPIVQKLRAVMLAAMDMPSVQQRLQESGGTVVSPARRTDDYLHRFLEADIKKWGEAVKAAGLTPD
jgi:tripartite-type tricarboxylate transporter receptor subunit TctC